VTPEKLSHGDDMIRILEKLYDEKMLARFVIDEAHLISTWGSDFREAVSNSRQFHWFYLTLLHLPAQYAALSKLRDKFPDVPIMALTATATPEVQQDVIHQLGLRDCVLLKQSFNRSNLSYYVRNKPQKVIKAIVDYIKHEHPGQAGIVYCIGREKCEKVAKALRDDGLSARHFHANLTGTDKQRTLDAWMDGRCQIIVGTVSCS